MCLEGQLGALTKQNRCSKEALSVNLRISLWVVSIGLEEESCQRPCHMELAVDTASAQVTPWEGVQKGGLLSP